MNEGGLSFVEPAAERGSPIPCGGTGSAGFPRNAVVFHQEDGIFGDLASWLLLGRYYIAGVEILECISL